LDGFEDHIMAHTPELDEAETVGALPSATNERELILTAWDGGAADLVRVVRELLDAVGHLSTHHEQAHEALLHQCLSLFTLGWLAALHAHAQLPPEVFSKVPEP
jgi:hypothetical protein